MPKHLATRLWERVSEDGLRETLRYVRQRMVLKAIDALSRPLQADTSRDACHECFRAFLKMVEEKPNGRVLEIGSRGDSSCGRRGHFPSCEYVGLDIHPGPNVDRVGDAHQLSSLFAPEDFDAVFSISVFEHLAMPWKVILEINRILKPGGLLFISTHPTWPAHELPWDFWRFSKAAFAALLHVRTGFEIIRCEEGLPCSIIPHGKEASMLGMVHQPAHLAVTVLARKIGECDPSLRWDVALGEILSSSYPAR
jgi:SAM-dependent methyltransferase